MLSSAGLKNDTKLESFQWSKAEPYTILISGFLIYPGGVRFKVCNSRGRIRWTNIFYCPATIL